MKSILFGNPNTDRWKLVLDDISRRQQIIAIHGELRAGFFSALTPMCLPPAVLQTFATELESLDQTLSGRAALQNANVQSEIFWVLSALPHDHIESKGRFTINGNNPRMIGAPSSAPSRAICGSNAASMHQAGRAVASPPCRDGTLPPLTARTPPMRRYARSPGCRR